MHFVLRADSGVTKMSDLAGKTLLLGKGSFGAREGAKYLKLFGLEGKVKLANVELNNAVPALKNRQIDGFVTAGSYPAPNVIEAAAGTGITVLSMTLDQVKKEILSNIHKNLIHIFKTKGTETSFRNLIRCFGVDDELIKLNSYANNQDYILEKKPNYTTVKQKSISFEGQNYQGTLYNTSSGTNSLGYITGSSQITPFTLEANIVFPKKVDLNQVKVNPSSLFGMHSVDGGDAVNGPLTFNSEDSGSMQVKFVKRRIDSEDGYFELTSSAGVFTALTSSYIPAVYDNSHWNVSVRVGAKSDIDFKDSLKKAGGRKMEIPRTCWQILTIASRNLIKIE